MREPHVVQHSTPATLIGLDVAGYSALFEAEVAREGRAALEKLTDALNSGCEAMLAHLAPYGFRFGAITGDCVICHALRAPGDVTGLTATALTDAMTTAAQAFMAASGVFSVRTAAVADVIVDVQICAPDNVDYTFLGGRGVVHLHEALRSAATLRAASGPRAQDRSRRDLSGSRAERNRALAATKAGRAGLRDAIVVFCRLCDGAAVHDMPAAALSDAVALLVHATAGIGGMFEKIAQDDKGVTAAMAFPAGVASEHAITTRLAAMAHEPLARLGFAPAWASSSGPVYAGAMLIAGRSVVTMHGPAVNRAAKRLKAPVGDIEPREATASAAVFDCAAPPLIGRRVELAALRDAALEAARGRTRLVIVEGEPGIGKTCLCDHALREFAAGFGVVRAACRPADAIVPLGLALPLLRQGLAQVGALRAWSQTQAVEACIRRYGGMAHEQMRRIAHVFLASGAPASAAVAQLTGEEVRALLEGLVEATFRMLADTVPVALVVDDIQWADRFSIGLIRRLARSPCGLLGLFGCRTASVAGHDGLLREDEELPLRVLRLEGLAFDEISELLRHTPGRDAGEGFDHACFEVVAGNPHFAIQYAELAAESGVLGTATATPMAPGSQAASMREAILVRRLDLLSDSERLMLRIAASVAEDLSDTDFSSIGARLGHVIDSATLVRQLASRSLLVRTSARPGEAARSRIAHQTLADAVTHMLPPSVVANLSEQIAQYASIMRRRGGPSLSRVSMAQLWVNAGRPARAAVLFGAEADAAMNIGAFDEATLLYGRAERLADRRWQTARRRALWSARAATARWGLGDICGAKAEVNQSFEGIDSWLRRRDADARERKYGLRWMAGRSLGRSLSPEVAVPLDIANAVRGELAYYEGELGEILRSNAIGVLGGGGAVTRKVGGRNHAMLGYMAGMMRMPALARVIFRRTSQRFADDLDTRPIAFVRASEAVLHLAFGRWDEAVNLLAEARAKSLDPYDPHLYEVTLTLLALGAHFSGQWESARDQFAELIEHARARGNKLHVAWGHYGQAQACLVGGRIEEADELLALAEPAVAVLGDRQSQLICLGLRAQILLATGRVGDALDKGEQAAAFARTVAPLNFSSLEGYAGAPTVALKALGLLPPGVQRERALHLLATGRKPLDRFALLFPIARPRALLALAASRQAGHRADAALLRSEMMAVRLRMPYELQLAREAAGSNVAGDPSARFATRGTRVVPP